MSDHELRRDVPVRAARARRHLGTRIRGRSAVRRKPCTSSRFRKWPTRRADRIAFSVQRRIVYRERSRSRISYPSRSAQSRCPISSTCTSTSTADSRYKKIAEDFQNFGSPRVQENDRGSRRGQNCAAKRVSQGRTPSQGCMVVLAAAAFLSLGLLNFDFSRMWWRGQRYRLIIGVPLCVGLRLRRDAAARLSAGDHAAVAHARAERRAHDRRSRPHDRDLANDRLDQTHADSAAGSSHSASLLVFAAILVVAPIVDASGLRDVTGGTTISAQTAAPPICATCASSPKSRRNSRAPKCSANSARTITSASTACSPKTANSCGWRRSISKARCSGSRAARVRA